MARIPDDRALGGRPTPRPTRGVPNTAVVAAGPRQAADAISRNAGQAGEVLRLGTEVAETMLQAEERIRTRDDAVARARAISDYNEQTAEALRNLQSEGDLSDRDTAANFIINLRENAARIVAEHGGSENSRAALAVRLEGIRTQYASQVADLRLQAQDRLVLETMGTALRGLTTSAYGTPSQIGELYQSLDAQIDDMAPALTPQQEMDLRTNGRSEIASSALEGLLDRGEYRAARDLMRETPGIANVLSPERQREILGRITTAEASRADGIRQGQEALNKARTILGREPTAAERVDLAGIDLSTDDLTPLEEIAQMEEALGRPLTEPEKVRHLGIEPPDQTEFDRRVAMYEARGFPRDAAQDLAAGKIQLTSPDQFGNVSTVNLATGTMRPVGNISGGAVTTVTEEERGRLTDQNAAIDRVLGLSEGLEESARVATGPGGSLRQAFNVLAGFIGSDAPVPAPETAEARQAIRLFNQTAKTAIVNNPRFPVAEQEVVSRMLPDESAFLANPSVEGNKVLQLRDYLISVRTQNMLSLGVAPQSNEAPTTPTISTPEEYEALPSGALYIRADDGLTYRKP